MMDVDEALARADAWATAKNARPEPTIAKAVAISLAQEVIRLRAACAAWPGGDVWAEGDDKLFLDP